MMCWDKRGESIEDYVRYHMHSDYSLLDSCTKFEDYVDAAVECGSKAIASTEHGKVSGWVSKKLYCDKKGIKFIHGVEIYLTESLTDRIRDNYHTVLLAKNLDGVKELNSLVSKSFNEDHFYYVNRISFDEFLKISDNIITTSACLASPLNKLPDDHPRYMELARKYTFLEVQPHVCEEQATFNKRLKSLSEKIGTPLIAGTDTHNLNQYKAECRAILTKAKGKKYDDDALDLTFKSLEELKELFMMQNALSEDDYITAINNTNVMADMCETFTIDTAIKYPILYGSQEQDEAKFEEIAWQKLDEKLETGIIPRSQEQAFRDSITEELRVFKKLHMGGFMLSMSELICWCKSQGMAIGTARGSVGGSRTAYVTDIIDLNPEQWHTVFSRFANEDRVEIGDIDIDCIDGDRPAIFNYIVGRFGADKTARVASYGTLVDKAAIDEIGRALRRDDDKKYALPVIDKIKKEYAADPETTKKKYPDIFYYLDGLMNTKVSQSVHPAGMVISPITLADNFGVFLKDGEYCLMLDMEEAHDVGMAKYDFLILKTVQVIRDTCSYLNEEYPKTYQVNWDDTEVWKDMCKDLTTIFQFESAFAADCFKKFKPESIFDMSLVTACIRPTGASYRDQLLARKQHSNPSPMIDELLKNNLGFLVYQEDTIAFLQQICGLSGSAADNIRRAIGRKQKDRLDAAMPSILEGYCSKSERPREEAEEEAKEFLKVIEDSASYQFGYNHSVAYCLLGYLCGFYRYYHPLEFLTSYLNNAANDEDIQKGTAYASKIGIRITMPKWGLSRSEYSYDAQKRIIAKGLASIKYMGSAVAEELYEMSKKKEYTSFMELLYDITHNSSLDARQLDILIKLDFFSEFGNQRELMRMVDFFRMFRDGDAKQIKRSVVDGTDIEPIIKKYAVGVTKAGGEAKSYTLLDVMAILLEIEKLVKSVGMKDLSDITKIMNFKDIMGYLGYVTGKEQDRRKLLVLEVRPLCRKSDGRQFGYSVFTKSIGSGKESRFTVMNSTYKRNPIRENEIIYCMAFTREGQYFKLTDYTKVPV